MNYIQPNWPAPSCIKAYTTTRHSWGKEYSNQVSEAANQQLEQLLALPSRPLWLNQTHSPTVIEATPANAGKIADASFSSKVNHICVVQTADCLPILICNKQGTHVAAIHAGWRGLAAGIIEATLQALNQPAEDILVWLGPAIGPQHFEVGKDVYDAFRERHETSITAFAPHTEGKWLANLYALAKIRLQLLGVSHIYGGDFCTYTQDHLFFSYRLDKGKTGRMASLIWIGDAA